MTLCLSASKRSMSMDNTIRFDKLPIDCISNTLAFLRVSESITFALRISKATRAHVKEVFVNTRRVYVPEGCVRTAGFWKVADLFPKATAFLYENEDSAGTKAMANINFFGSPPRKSRLSIINFFFTKPSPEPLREPLISHMFGRACAAHLTSLNVIMRSGDERCVARMRRALPRLKHLFYVSRNPTLAEVRELRKWSTSSTSSTTTASNSSTSTSITTATSSTSSSSHLKSVRLDLCYEERSLSGHASRYRVDPLFAVEVSRFGSCVKHVSFSFLSVKENRFASAVAVLLQKPLPRGLQSLCVVANAVEFDVGYQYRPLRAPCAWKRIWDPHVAKARELNKRYEFSSRRGERDYLGKNKASLIVRLRNEEH